MNFPEALILFLFGLTVGSFLNVFIYRLPRNEGFLKGRSFCDNCKKNLAWYDLVPLLSFVFLKGKCRFCKKKINRQIPLVELTTGLLFVAMSFKFPVYNIVELSYALFFVSSLIAIFIIDLNHNIIPDKIVYPAFFITFIYVLFNQDLFAHSLSAIVSFIFFFALLLITKGKGMGFGDVKFAGMLGLFFGFPKIILALYLAFLTGAVVGLILILWRKKSLKGATIPFGPFLVIGSLITVFLADYLVSLWSSFS